MKYIFCQLLFMLWLRPFPDSGLGFNLKLILVPSPKPCNSVNWHIHWFVDKDKGKTQCYIHILEFWFEAASFLWNGFLVYLKRWKQFQVFQHTTRMVFAHLKTWCKPSALTLASFEFKKNYISFIYLKTWKESEKPPIPTKVVNPKAIKSIL